MDNNTKQIDNKIKKKQPIWKVIIKVIALIIGIILLIISTFSIFVPQLTSYYIYIAFRYVGIDIYPDYRDPFTAYKPVIYLYPEEETKVHVELALNGELTCTYPKYNNETGWNVTAYPDGTLVDEECQEYNYLYWEGLTNADWDMSTGYCIKGEDTAKFLEVKLAELGLNRKEANEFIVYWLPQMEPNKYNIISFQTDVYTDAAKLDVVPAPDTVIRVFMVYQGVDEFIDIEPQVMNAHEREGFTVIEWGGTEVTNRRQ